MNGLIEQFASNLTTSSNTKYTFAVTFNQRPSILCCTNSGEGYNPPYWAFGWLKSKSDFYYGNISGGIDFIAIGY